MTAPAWTILAFWGAIGVAARVVQAVRRRRADRAWAAGVARKVRDAQAEVAALEALYAMESAGERP